MEEPKCGNFYTRANFGVGQYFNYKDGNLLHLLEWRKKYQKENPGHYYWAKFAVMNTHEEHNFASVEFFNQLFILVSKTTEIPKLGILYKYLIVPSACNLSGTRMYVVEMNMRHYYKTEIMLLLEWRTNVCKNGTVEFQAKFGRDKSTIIFLFESVEQFNKTFIPVNRY